jgi:hypothetical protein
MKTWSNNMAEMGEGIFCIDNAHGVNRADYDTIVGLGVGRKVTPH